MEKSGAAAAASPRPAPKNTAAAPTRRGAAGNLSRAAPQSSAQQTEVKRAAKEEEVEEEDPENSYEGVRLLLFKCRAWVEVKERTWRIGRIYASLGVCDALARVLALRLFQDQYGWLRTASVSDTQALDYTSYGRPADIENSALVRLTITASAGFIRSIVSFFLLWKAFPHLRPSWDGKPSKRLKLRRGREVGEGGCRPDMVTLTRLLRVFLVLWCLFDIIQVCVPEDSNSEKLTPHRAFKYVSESAFFFVHILLLKTLRYDREALRPFVYAGYFIMVMIVFTGLWLDYRMSRLPWEYSKVLWASVQWTFMAQMESLIIFAGVAMPDSLTLSMGFQVARTGKALPWEDDSFINRPTPPKAPSPKPTASPSAPTSAADDPDALAPLSDADTVGSGKRQSGSVPAISSQATPLREDQEVDF